MGIWVRAWPDANPQGCRNSNPRVSIIELKNKAFAASPFCLAVPEPSSAPGQIPKLCPLLGTRGALGGGVGCWEPGGGASGPSSLGGDAARRVWAVLM